MGLLSIFKRTSDPAAASSVADAGDAVQQARTRARRRLIGAVVLLVIWVIGFPLVFETRPRPVSVDIPIEIPRQDSAPALVMPPARSFASAPAPAVAMAPASSAAEVITESRGDAGREVAGRAIEAKASSPSASRPAAAPPPVEAMRKPAPSLPPATSSAVAATTKAPASSQPKAAASPTVAEAARPKATAETKPAPEAKTPPSNEAGRFVVQVGAFAEAESARETRQKAEKLGLKTYTQVAQTPGGNRIRVRIGPFANRAEADAALSKARAAGLTAVVLTL
jgi:DedD protein